MISWTCSTQVNHTNILKMSCSLRQYHATENKKLCYRKEDSASVMLRWFTSLSALISATYGHAIPDFSNWCLSRTHWSSIDHISTFWQGRSHRCLSIMPSFSVTSANIAISDTSLKLDSFGYISIAESMVHLQPLLRYWPRKLPNSVKKVNSW